RKLLAALDGGFIGRTPGIEKLDELLAGAVVVPFAVALDDGEQLLERVGAAALAVEGERQIEARLVVERIGGDLLLELADRAERLGLLGKLEGGGGRCDAGVILLALRHHGERLPRLIERASLHIGARQTAER